MFKEIQKESSLVRIALILIIIVLCVHLFGIFWQVTNVFSDIIGIVVIAWLLSFVLEPIVDKITDATPLSKTSATAMTYLLLFAGIVFIGYMFVPLVNSQISTLSKTLPSFLASSPKFISKWSDSILDTLSGSIIYLPSVAQFMLSFLIVLVISFYFIIDKDRINKEFYALTPKTWHEKMHMIQKVTAKTFASFVRIQLIIGILTGVLSWIVLQLFGVEFALAIALLSGILGTLPVIGPIIAAIPPVFFIALINPWFGVSALLIITIVDQVIFNIFVPRAFGKALKIHPVIILLSSIAGFKLGGAIGAIFAIPVAGISAVIIKEIWEYFFTDEKEVV